MTQATTVSCAKIVVRERSLPEGLPCGSTERLGEQLMEDRKWGVVLFVLMMAFMINLIVGVL